MFEFITDVIAKEPQYVVNQPPAIIQTAICNTKELDQLRECINNKFKDDDKTPDPYQDMWNPDWIKKK